MLTSSASRPALDDAGPPEPRISQAGAPGDRRLGVGIAIVTVLVNVALVLPFLGKDWLLGDLAYHRGVTLTIDLAHPFGEGPIAGVMSYYGGTYHLVLAALMRLADLTFEAAIAVLSLAWAVVWPLALLVLGRRLWPLDWISAAVFALVGTLVMPLTMAFATDLWVESILPSGMALWPAYPRDIATSFGLLALASTLGRGRRARIIGTGACLAIAITTNVQIAVTFAIVIGAWGVYSLVRAPDGRRVLVDAAAGIGSAALLSAWWWLPRVAPTFAGATLLADAPDRLPFRMTPIEFILQLSWIGALAVVALVPAVIRRRAPGGHPVLAIWVALLVPLIVVDRLGIGSAFAPERRTWLQLSIPFAAIAAFELVDVLRRFARPVVAVALAVVLVAAALPGAAATVYGIGRIWEDRRISGRAWPAADWDRTLAELRSIARTGPTQILTYDTEAPWIWSRTGAHVFSLWLPGPIKLGFDPQVHTGIGFLDRVGRATEAFDRGLDGVCQLAEAQGIDTILLRSLDGLVATHDHAFAAPYRTDPAKRATTPATRRVGNGRSYFDSGPDWLLVDRTGSAAIPFRDRGIETIVVEARNVEPTEVVTLTLVGEDVDLTARTEATSGVQELRFDLPEGASTRSLRLRSDGEVLLLRALGYESVDLGQPPSGAFLTTQAAVCRAVADG